MTTLRLRRAIRCVFTDATSLADFPSISLCISQVREDKFTNTKEYENLEMLQWNSTYVVTYLGIISDTL